MCVCARARARAVTIRVVLCRCCANIVDGKLTFNRQMKAYNRDLPPFSPLPALLRSPLLPPPPSLSSSPPSLQLEMRSEAGVHDPDVIARRLTFIVNALSSLDEHQVRRQHYVSESGCGAGVGVEGSV